MGIFSTPYSAVLAITISTDMEPSLICKIDFIQNTYTISLSFEITVFALYTIPCDSLLCWTSFLGYFWRL